MSEHHSLEHNHCHTDHNHHRHSHSSNPFLFPIFLTGSFFIVELIAAYFSGSLALLSDAGHMFVDLGALLLGLFSHWLMHRPKSKQATYGYLRVEVLGCVFNALLIWILVGFLISESWERFQNPAALTEIKGGIVALVGMLGLLVNWMSLKRLHQHSHEGMHVDAAALHVFFDLLGSVAAMISGVVIYFTDWRLIDPIATLFTCVLVLSSSWKIFKTAIEILLEKSPPSINIDEVQKNLESIEGVKKVHHLHIWRISSNSVLLTAHLGIEEFSPSVSKVLKDAQNILKEKHEIIHSTLQLELATNECQENC